MTVYAPTTLQQACEMLHAHPDAHVLAGGTDFMVEVNFHHRKPSTVVHLNRIHELRQWSVDEKSQTVRIGSTVPFAQLESQAFNSLCPALAQAARTVGSPQIRTMGSIGGNLGTCSPAGDSLPVLSALDAEIEIASMAGLRTLSIHEFMVGPKRNALAAGEIISAVQLPLHNGPQWYAKVGTRNAMVIAVASVCFALQDDTPRIALGSAGPTVIRCREAEEYVQSEFVRGNAVDREKLRTVGHMVASASRPIDDHRSTAQYRRHAVNVVSQRLIEKSF